MRKGEEPRSLRELFIRPLRNDKRPPRDQEAFLRAKAARRKLDDEIAKAQHEIELAEGGPFLALLKAAGLEAEALKKSLAEASAVRKSLRAKLGADLQRHQSFVAAERPVDTTPASDCKDITIHVCKQRICYRGALNVTLDSITPSDGFDGQFELVDDVGFVASDYVEGSSGWNATYHRHYETHEGEIVMVGCAELTTETRVYGFGFAFWSIDSQPNSEWAHGDNPIGSPPFGKPSSTGHVKAWKRLRVHYRVPDGEWQELEGPEHKYIDNGPIDGNVAAGPNLGPPDGELNVKLDHDQIFPAGTEFIIEAEVRYWIRGYGEGGEARIDFGIRPTPFIDMDSCFYDYPNRITIDLDDYP